MFGQVLLMQFKQGLRNKQYMFWTVFFPIALGTLFSFAFKSIYNNEQTQVIPVAVIVEDSAIEEYKVMEAFSGLGESTLEDDVAAYQEAMAVAAAKGEECDMENPVSDELSEALDSVESFDDLRKVSFDVFPEKYVSDEVSNITENDLPFIDVINTVAYEDGTHMLDRKDAASMEEAEQLLRDGDITGIIVVSSLTDISLKVYDNGTSESILTSIISTYKRQMDMVIAVMNDDELSAEYDNMDSILDEKLSNIDFVEASGIAGDNKDPFVAYFYNLIAMICLMGSMSALSAIVHNQANQSTEGMRIDISPVNKTVYELAQYVAITIMQLIILMAALTYYMYVLKIRYGGDVGMIYLTAAASSFLGTSLGFMVGHIGTAKEDFKNMILLVITVGGGFMSGLMYPDMKAIIEEKFPLFNRINPSAVLTDAFLTLNLYGVGARYYRTMAYVGILTVVFMAVGIAFSRRKQYASL